MSSHHSYDPIPGVLHMTPNEMPLHTTTDSARRSDERRREEQQMVPMADVRPQEPVPDPRPALLKKAVRELVVSQGLLERAESELMAVQAKCQARLGQVSDFTEAVLKLADGEQTFLVMDGDSRKVVTIRVTETGDFVVTVLDCEEA